MDGCVFKSVQLLQCSCVQVGVSHRHPTGVGCTHHSHTHHIIHTHHEKGGEELDRGSLVSATCALHRLVHRRGGLWPSLEDPSGGFSSEESYLVVSYDEVGPQMLADVLAAYLHWFGGMTLADAIKVGMMCFSVVVLGGGRLWTQ